MWKTIVGASFVALGVLAAASLNGGDAFAQSSSGADRFAQLKGGNVCYAWSIFPGERFRLDIRRHSPLTTREEKELFGHSLQVAYSVHGKHVIGDTMHTVHGTVVVARGAGAHAGFDSIAARGDGVTDFARPVNVECTTDEASPTPATWSCQSRNEFDIYHGISTLTAVDPLQDELCSVFENGSFEDDTQLRAPGELSSTSPAPQE